MLFALPGWDVALWKREVKLLQTLQLSCICGAELAMSQQNDCGAATVVAWTVPCFHCGVERNPSPVSVVRHSVFRVTVGSDIRHACRVDVVGGGDPYSLR